ncbi:ATP-binding protein [Shewanella algae]|uniref:ATP-binding protein n=1 Tax=Shewanella algae TaxID=38313 RepID=UPI00313B2DEA
MNRRYIDPFTPDLPIDTWERFSGRRKEIDSVVDSLYQLSNEKPKHTIITGDRGIGKSSVLTQVNKIAEGDFGLPSKLNIDTGTDRYDFLCAWHDCATDQSPSILASGILSQLKSSLENAFGKIKIELNICGFVKVAQRDNSISSIGEIVDLFCSELSKAAIKAKEQGKTGVILFFDELDRVKPDSGVATFFKLSAEKLSRDNIKNVAFFAAGITGAIQNLEEEHGSIYRTFKDVPLPRIEKPEVKEILMTGFNAVERTYDEVVIDGTFKLCAGYPEPVHLIGSQILKSDKDGHLDAVDFEDAKLEVVQTLRRNKLAATLKSAGSGKYQSILKSMANYESANVPLSHITKEIGYEQNQYSTNMSNLIKRDIISQVDRGVYCFVDPLLKEYISRFGVINAEDEE